PLGINDEPKVSLMQSGDYVQLGLTGYTTSRINSNANRVMRLIKFSSLPWFNWPSNYLDSEFRQ
ncbi:MAG: hypothetical protein CMQ17_10495, partial [Gammaproteobacteria bacterium]|nr:hypothetical protein [Gammaproteobacteria bacterium]